MTDSAASAPRDRHFFTANPHNFAAHGAAGLRLRAAVCGASVALMSAHLFAALYIRAALVMLSGSLAYLALMLLRRD